MLDSIRNKKFYVYKNLNLNNPLVPIAVDEVFLRNEVSPNACILHLHSLQNSAILGTPDVRLPFFTEAISTFYQNNITPAVRNIGGLGIIANEGVLNMSFIMNTNSANFSINAGYEMMMNFIKEIFPEACENIKAYEITTSYCPGDYDLSINGKKFAGIAQRKIKDTVVISIYLSLFGDQAHRARLMHDFYNIGIKDQVISYKYPHVDENSMASLEQLLHKKYTFEEVFERITKVLYELNCDITLGQYSSKMVDSYEKIYEQLKERNKKFFN